MGFHLIGREVTSSQRMSGCNSVAHSEIGSRLWKCRSVGGKMRSCCQGGVDVWRSEAGVCLGAVLSAHRHVSPFMHWDSVEVLPESRHLRTPRYAFILYKVIPAKD